MRKHLLPLALAAGPVFAQPLLPPRLEPMPEPQFLPEKPAAPGLLQAPAPTPPAQLQAPSGRPPIPIRAFRILGVTAFSEAQIQEVTAPFVGRGLTPEDLEELRYRLTRLYVDQGFLNSGAVLEGVDATDGVVTYRVVEGVLADIRVRGTERLDPAYVTDRVALSAGPPLNTQRLQEGFQLLLQDPLIERLNGALAPGKRPGEAVLDLEVQRARPYDLRIGIDNYKPVSTGEFEGTLDGTLRNLFGGGDALTVGLAGSEGYLDGRADFELPVNAYDTRIRLGLEGSRSEVVEEPLDELDIVGYSSKVALGVTHPLWNSLAETLQLGAELSMESSRNEMLGEPFSFTPGEEDGESRVAALDLAQTYTRRAANVAWSAQSILTVGLDTLGATDHGGDLPDGQFVAWLGRFQYARRLPQTGGQVLFHGDLQISSDPLLPLSRFAVGGAATVRGYRENRLVGDEGYIASVEYRHPLTFVGSEGVPGKLSLLGFYDTGSAWAKGESADETLNSLGLGLRWQPARQFALDLAWAHPLNDDATVDGDAWQDEGVHIRLSWEL